MTFNLLHKSANRQSLILSPGPPIPTNLLCLPTYSINLCPCLLSALILGNLAISAHCNENPPIYICVTFLGIAGPSPKFHIQVSVIDLYIPRIGTHISCSRMGRSIVGIYKSLRDTLMWKLWLWPRNSFSVNICFDRYWCLAVQVSRYSSVLCLTTLI